jgi:hypothetical protein
VNPRKPSYTGLLPLYEIARRSAACPADSAA